MKLHPACRCKKCGSVYDLDRVLDPPKDGKPAETKPCPSCGANDWSPARASA